MDAGTFAEPEGSATCQGIANAFEGAFLLSGVAPVEDTDADREREIERWLITCEREVFDRYAS